MGQAASTTSASQALYASAKTGCAADVQRLAATGAGLEWRDQKGRTPLMVAVINNHLQTVQALLNAGADVHAVGRPGEPALSPLHHAVANGNEAMVALLLAANASPFLVVGEATPLDAASAAGLTSIVRRCEACGLFASWLYKCEQPHGLRGMLTGRATWELRWTAVVPRFRQTSGGLLCKHQLRTYRALTDAEPVSVFDVESAAAHPGMAGSASVLAHPKAGPPLTLFFTAAPSARGAPSSGMQPASAQQLVDACNNRAPPRVPALPRRASSGSVNAPPSSGPPSVAASHAAAAQAQLTRRGSSPSRLPPPSSVSAPPRPTAAPSPPPRAPAAPPPPPPSRGQAPAPPPSTVAAAFPSPPNSNNDAELAEAIRRSLQDAAVASPAQAPVSAPRAVVSPQPSSPPPSRAPAPSPPPPSAPPLPAPTLTFESPSGAGAAAAACLPEPAEDDQCCVCMSEPKTAGLLHGASMHIVCCNTCAPHLVGKPCPLCRAPVERVVNGIYR